MCLVVFSHLDNAPDYLVGCVIQKRFGLSWPKFFEKDLTLKLNSKYYIVANFSRAYISWLPLLPPGPRPLHK